MDNQFIISETLPFCKGCGHATVSKSTEKALQKLELNPTDVILVTDIGCHGIIDKAFATHTVHGLHGRSVALGSGISAGLNNPDKKVIVFVGDGGATIGMQHLIDASHNGFNMTVVIHNNMLYGMTGGQPSEFTPEGFKTPTLPEGAQHPGYDICSLATQAGASYVRRITAIGDISEELAEAFSRKGFSLLEIMEICPSYGVKSNPGLKLKQLVKDAGIEIKIYVDKEQKAFQTQEMSNTPELLTPKLNIEKKFEAKLEKPIRMFLSGSAGEGVQSAAELFIRAGMKSGLHVTKKGSYPVTVGVGFSASHLILSPDEILYSGSPQPDVMIVTSADGLKFARKQIEKLSEDKILFIDESLEKPETKAQLISMPLRKEAGARNAMIFALFHYLQKEEFMPMETLKEVFGESKISGNKKLKELVESSF
ncbi:MAG: 2-oxoacid:acceptor oxidoreductase family protein [Bacteroidales bacterium]|nr:2-oxoacid:acceptor oxidoreductase family protein [Bacteroidales bacterium]MCF8388570.1 2-oxoacid:acceptor oxidoreductase family protein [Bacteroidales bacterium]MCF8397300.1 2-oxoacid:acceptor oxidoreductase family protein [Bacteroidales bacterium]